MKPCAKSGLSVEISAAGGAEFAGRGDFVAAIATGVNTAIFYIYEACDGKEHSAYDPMEEEEAGQADEHQNYAGCARSAHWHAMTVAIGENGLVFVVAHDVLTLAAYEAKRTAKKHLFCSPPSIFSDESASPPI